MTEIGPRSPQFPSDTADSLHDRYNDSGRTFGYASRPSSITERNIDELQQTRAASERNKLTRPRETGLEAAYRLLPQYQDSAVSIQNNLFGLMGTSEGSGAFVSAGTGKRGHCDIATDNHVVDTWLHTHEIKLANGESYNASVVFRDLANDLAILRIYGVSDPQKTCKPVTLEEAEHPLNPEDTTVLLSPRLTLERDDMLDLERLRRALRWPRDLAGSVFKYGPANAARVEDWQTGEVQNRDTLFITQHAFPGDSGAAVLNPVTDKVVGFVDRGGKGAFTQVTPSSFLRKDLDELHRRDAEEEEALKETLLIPPLF